MDSRQQKVAVPLSRSGKIKGLIVLLTLLLGLLAASSIASAAKLDGAAHGGRPFSVELTGAAEAPGPGDPDGSGTALLTLNPGQEEVCFEIVVSNIALPATGAHIHKAPVGDPGPIVVPLTAPGEDGTSSGCVPADRDLIIDILQNPSDYYVNVHSTEYPPGAVRGQLSR